MKNKVRVIATWDTNAKCLEEKTLEYVPRVGEYVIVESIENRPFEIKMVVHNMSKNAIDIIVYCNPNIKYPSNTYADMID
jgi:hypothetical protein